MVSLRDLLAPELKELGNLPTVNQIQKETSGAHPDIKVKQLA